MRKCPSCEYLIRCDVSINGICLKEQKEYRAVTGVQCKGCCHYENAVCTRISNKDKNVIECWFVEEYFEDEKEN